MCWLQRGEALMFILGFVLGVMATILGIIGWVAKEG